MLREVPNNNGVMDVAIVLNKVPNSSDSIRVAKNVHLNTMGA